MKIIKIIMKYLNVLIISNQRYPGLNHFHTYLLSSLIHNKIRKIFTLHQKVS